MKQFVAIVSKIEDTSGKLIAFIEEKGFSTMHLKSVESLENILAGESPMILMIDIDSLPLDNKHLFQLHRKSTGTSILLLSSRKAHPELREAIGRYVYACISKPLDLDEVDYWLKSILEDLSRPVSNHS